MFETIRVQLEAATVSRGHAGGTTSGPVVRTPGLNGVTEKYSDGSYLDFTDGAAGATGEYFEFTVEVPESGSYALDFRYALAAKDATGVAQDRPLNLSINGQSPSSVSFPSTTAKVQGGFSEWGVKSQSVALNAGPNTIRLASNGLNGANFDWVEIRSPASPAPVQLPTVQAETGTVGGTAPGSTIHITSQVVGGPTFHPNSTGTGFTDIGAAADAFLELTVAAPTAGLYRLDFRYANGDSGNLARPMAVAVNGVGAGSLAFPVPPGAANPNRFATWGFAEIEVELRAGDNVVRLVKLTGVNHGGPNIDAVTPTRLAAPTSIELVAVTVTENVAGAQAGTLSVVDEDGGTYAYTVSDTRFEIIAGQLKLKAGQALNFEAGATVEVTVTADDGPTGFAPIGRTFTVAVTNANDAPTLLGEQGAASVVAGADFELAAELIPADEDAGSMPVLIATLANGEPLPAGLALVGRGFTTDAALAPGSYNIALLASDGASQSPAKTFTLTVTAPLVAPTFSTPDALSSAENQTAVATVQATDPDSPTLTYAIVGGADEALFTINAATGALAFTNAPDFEAPADAGGDNVYNVELSVTDETGLVASQDFALTVTDVAEVPNDVPPAFTVFTAAAAIAENTTTVFDFEATDADGDAVSYAVAGVDGALFGITAEGVLSFIAAPDAELPGDAGSNGIYQITVQATARGVTVGQAVSITVADVNEAVAVQQSAFTVTEPASAVGVITVRDEDGGTAGLVAPSFALSGTDAAVFTLNATTGALSFTSPRDFETPSDAGGDNVYDIVVTATDGALSDAQAITVTVADLDETPFTPITLQAESAQLPPPDNVSATIENVVRDAANPETGSFTGLRAGFSGTGYLDFGNKPGDRATFTVTLATAQAGTYDLNFRYGSNGVRPLSLFVNGGAAVNVPFPTTAIPASGGNPAVEGFNNWQFFTVPVTLAGGVNSLSLAIPAGFSSGPNIDRIEITAAGSGPLDLTADADNNLALTGPATVDPAAATAVAFTVAGRDADIVTTQVSFDGGTTRTTVTPDATGVFSLDLSGRPAGATTVTLIVTDDAGNQATQERVVTIAAADQPPVFAATPNDLPVLENTTAVGTIAATDADGDAVAYSLVGADAALFAISTAGVLSFRTAPDAEAPDDVGANGIYQVTVQATAGAAVATKDLTITLTDTNELIFIDQSAFSVAEGTTAVGIITAGDEDGGTSQLVAPRFSIAGGADAAAFTLDAVTGVLSFKTERDFEAPTDAGRNNVYNVVVTARDGALSDNQAIAVTVTNVSEAPFAPFAVQAEAAALTILDTDANTNDTVVRDAANPETGASFPGGSGLRPGFSGTGYLDFGDTPGDRATFTVTVREAGPYDLNIRYAANDARPLDLSLNGAAASTVPFVGTGLPASGATPAVEGVNRWVFLTVPVTLTAGSNTISLTIPAGRASGPNIDRIEITAAGAGPIDDSADVDANLTLTGPAGAVQGAAGLVAFTVAGRDADIVTTQVSFDGGTTRALVTPDTAGVFNLDLSARLAGATTVTLIVTDDAGNEARDEQVVTITPATPQNFNQVIEAETFVITDTTRATALETTQTRTAANPEPNPLARDTDANGLWDGFNGAGYLDMGANVGDAAAFTINAPTAGTYTLTFRYANGANPAVSRPMTLQVGGAGQGTIAFASTGAGGWDNWTDVSVDVTLTAGANVISLANTVANGANIDRVTVRSNAVQVTEPGPRTTIKIDFQDGATPRVAGYLADNFQGFGNRGNGYSYGWVTEASAIDADGTTATPIDGTAYPAIAINERSGTGTGIDSGRNFGSYDPRLTGYAHFDLPGYPARAAWQIALENGFYEVTVSVGDTGGANDSVNRLLVEGTLASSFTPTNTYKSELVTVQVQVQDGFLTLAAPAPGSITEIQYLEIRALPDLTPADGLAATADYASFDQPRAVGGVGAGSVTVPLTTGDGTPAIGVDPTSDLFLGVQVAAGRGGVLLESLRDGSIRLYETLTGDAVAFGANTTAGFDSLTITPTGALDPFTSYTLVIDGLRDRGANGNDTSATREFQKFTTTFVTGAAPAAVDREVAFRDVLEVNGGVDGAYGFSTVELSPDGRFLYAATLGGDINRWAVSQTDGSLSGQQTISLDHFAGDAAGRRGIIGMTFDPTNPNVIWVSDNYAVPLEGRSNSVPDFSGRISRITLGAGPGFTATAQTYVTGLPRSNGDHLTNSLEFRANPAAGQAGEPSHLLYLTQGSNSAMGRPDDAWGQRGERLLNAAILEIDPTRTAPTGGFNVQTEPTPPGNTVNPASTFNADGTVNGFYNPFATDAVVRLFATGTRNAYDLVWHSNGFLYVPTNGSAAGGNTPDNPATPQNEALTNASLQSDYLFRVQDGGYYGHPNALRDEFILNGGNPTAGVDRNEVLPSAGRAGYAAGVAPDPNYRAESAYSLGFNRSPNGATEYKSAVFGTKLKGAVLFTEYSGGNDIRAVLLDANGFVTQDFVLKNASGATIQYTDPLDIIENPATGQLYLLTLNRSNGESQIVRLDPNPGGTVTPPPPTGERVLLRTVQAEDNTPGDGTSVTIAAPPAGQIVIRTTANPETSGSVGLVGGLRPGAFGLDGNTVNTDGVAGGYADFGATNADFMTFTINLTAAEAGAAVLAFRYANGSDPAAAGGGARPLAVLVNGVQVGIPAFAPGAGATTDARLANWLVVEVPATLIAGANTITLQATANIGPNVDQLEVFRIGTPTPPPTTGLYEAELAARTPGAIVDTIHAGFTGTGFVDYVAGAAGDPNPKLTFSVTVATAGSYEVQIRYSNRTVSGPRPLGLEVNGAAQGTLPFVPVGTLDTNYGIQTATLQLQAGTNTIGLTAPGGVGPNIDSLFVPATPSAPPFVPTYAAIPATEAGGKIELETGTTARVVNDSAVEFYFTVAADGLYALDLAATVDAEDGVGLTLLLNGTEVARADYPQGGEETVYLDLRAGVNYQLRANSAQTGASGLDYLEVRRAPGDVNADIAVQSLDPGFYDNRLHFSFIENPDFNNDDGTPGADRVFKDSAQVRISNTGTSPLSVLEATLSGPFKLATPGQLDGLVLQAGQGVTVTVLFDRAAYTPPTTNVDATSTVFTGGLRLLTNDAENPSTTIDLAGFWQNVDEGGQEPNVNEVWQVFGFGNVIEGLSTRGGGENSVLDRADRYESSDVTEVLSPYWRLADGVAAATITQLAAFHGPGGATVGIHGPGNSGGSNQVQFWNHTGEDNQRLLPRSGTGFATRTFNNATIPDVWAGNEVFGIEIAGLSTDPRLNPVGPVVVPGVQQGYTMRMFQAVDLRGAAIANTFLGIMDYTGINYDYNDNVILIEGVTPVGTGAEIDVTNRDGAPSDKRLVMSRIDNPANATQVVHDTATIRITNPGAAALEITSLTVADPAAFQLVGAPTATTIAAGAFLDVTVRFIGSDPLNDDAAVAFESQLVILSNDFDEGRTVIELAGLAQFQSEGGEEPKVQQIVDAFGFSTDVAEAQINKGGLVEANGDEILSPYFVRANGAAPITITQLAAYHGQGDVARLYVHDVDSRQLTQIIAHDEQDGQTLLPRTLNGGAALATASLNRNDPFGFFAEIVGRQGFLSWSDPDANLYEDTIDAVGTRGANLGWDSGDGHLIRVYVAKDAAGVVIPDTLLVVQDYAGVNYDYNDNIFLVRNVRSYSPAGVEDADRNGRVDIYDDADGDGTPNFAEPPPQTAFGGTARVIGAGPAPVTLNATVFDVGGQGVAYNDLTPQDEGGTQGRNEGPDVLGNNTAIGFVAPGEWLEYTVNVAVAGAYTLNVNAASPDPGRTVSASFAQGGTVYATAPNAVVVDTNNYTSFTPSAPVSVNLRAGEQVVRLTFGVGSFDIQSFTLDRANFAPVVAVPLTAQSGQQGQAFSYTLPAGTFTDADNEALSYTATGLPGGLTISAAGVISGTPTVSGTFTATVRASDGTVSTPTTLALTLAAAPPPPVPVQTPFGGAARVIGAGPAPVTLNATVFDVGGQGVAYNDLTPQDEGGAQGRNEGPDVLGNNTGVGWIAPGEWLEYTVNVAQAGAYTFTVNAASPDPGRTVSASFAQGGTVYATAPNAGVVDTNNYTSFTPSAPVSVNLRGGEQVIRLTFGGGGFDLQSFTLDRANFAPVAAVPLPAATGQQGQAFSYALPAGTFTDADNETLSYSATGLPGGLTISAAGVISGTPTASGTFTTVVSASDGQASTTTNLALTLTAAPPPPTPVQTPFGGTARVIGAGPAPVTLNATVFDVGGQGVAYNDLTSQDEGGSLGRNEGVDVLGNNLGVGWIAPGEWLEYTVNVAQAGAYTFRANAASPDPGRTVSASFAQAGAVYATAPNAGVVDTNNYTSFTPSAPVGVNLRAGEQVVRLTFGGGSFDLQSFTLDRANFAPVAAVPLPAATGQQGQAFSYALPAGTFTDADNEALSYTATGLPSGLTISVAGVISGTPTASGTFTALVSASDGQASATTNLALTLAAAPPPSPVQTPVGGTARVIGGGPAAVTLNATVFDVGGQGVAYNDTTAQDEGGTAGRNEGVDVLGDNLGIGWIAPGEWVEYTVNVAQAGAYTFTANAASPDPGRTVSASFAQSGTVYATAPNAGVVDTNNYTSFTPSAPVGVNLRGGEQVIRLTFGGGGFDLQSFTLDRSRITGTSSANTLNGGAGNDVLDGGAGNDTLVGGSGDDVYYVDATLDVVTELAGEGTDQVYATVSSYTLGNNVENLSFIGTGTFAGNGNTLGNRITGGAGVDTLFGSGGRDILTGDAGADLFRFTATTDTPVGIGADLITDFSTANGDRLDLSAIDADSTLSGNQGFSFIGTGALTGKGQVRAALQSDGNTHVSGTTTNGTPSFEIVLAGNVNLQASSFVL